MPRSLSLERICYVIAWHRPAAFARAGRRWRIGGDPVTALERAFHLFKLVQAAVFIGWWAWFTDDAAAVVGSCDEAILLGGLLVVAGQTLTRPRGGSAGSGCSTASASATASSTAAGSRTPSSPIRSTSEP